jgi:dephospho-CoA kinase
MIKLIIFTLSVEIVSGGARLCIDFYHCGISYFKNSLSTNFHAIYLLTRYISTFQPLSRALFDEKRTIVCVKYLEAAAFIGIDDLTALKAQNNLIDGKIILLAVSGKLASGKDSVARAAVTELGYPDASHHYYAAAMKNEVDQAIAIISNAKDANEAVRRIVDEQDVPENQARKVTGWLLQALNDNPSLHSRIRSKIMRDVLQLWGTEIRRAQDPDYWVKKTLRAAIAAASQGESIYITDVRFPNEVLFAQALGFTVVRIEISPETQANRLAVRDSLPISPDTLNHSSETALDNFAGFDLVLDNNGPLASTVTLLVDSIRL